MSVSTRTDTTLSKDAGEEVKLRMHETIQKAGADGNSVLRGLVLAQKGRSHCVPSGEEMKFRSALLLYSCLAWTQAEEPESRFGLVISTLEEIGKNIDKESARETASFTKFQAWCSDEIEGLSSGSEKSKDSSEKAFVQLRELTASISVLESGIANLQGDVKELQDAQDQISNIREEEASKYNEEVDLNTESARTVDKALSKIGAKSSFLQRQQSLEPDSGYVLGLLRGIKERLNQTRSELDQTEEAKKKTHSTLFKAKKDQLAVLQAEVLEKTRLLQQNKVQLVEAQRIHDQEKESSKEMISMQAETKKKCAEKADEYKTRQEDKKNEKAAITEAVTLLKQEEAGAKNAAGAVFFLQTSSGHKSGQMSEDKKDLVRNAVWLMQQQTADKVKGMGKAAEAVLGLVEAIRGHQAEDTKRKQFCEFQMDGSQDTKAKLEGDVARLKARQDYLTSEVSSLTTEVEALKKDAAKFTDRLSQLEEVRGKEQDSYKASTRDRGLTLKVVKKAKSIVEGFYKSKDPTSFSQEEASPPKVPWKLGSSRNGNLGSSVIAMLDTIVDDFGKEQQDADKAEEKAEKELAQVRSETKSLFDKKLDHVSKLLQEKARDAQELSQVKADAELKTSSLAATEDALAKLGKDCTKLLADYEKVSEERQKQIWQLQDVADILSGAKASGTLEPAPHNPTMRALLERYTQSHTLTERDEDGEHPLFPQSRSRGRAEQRPGHAAGGAELVLAKESIASSREQILISRVLHKIDTEKLTHVKDAFMEKDNALTSKDFVDLLLPTVRSMEGGEEQVVAALQLVHEMIGQGVKGEDESEKESEVKETAQEDELMNPAFMTEAQVEEETQKLVSWEVFAKLLLQEGVVANVVSGFNLAQVLSVIDLEKITPLQAIFEKKGNVDLESFVVIMKGQFQQVFELIALFELYEDERKIITQLVNLFDAIDVDCNGSMTWEEFTAFLVDQGMAEDVPQQYNIIRFSQSPLKDGNGHQSHCEKVIYLKGYDKVAFVEQGSKCLKLCSPDMKPYFEIRDFTQTPLCAEYIENPVQRRHGFLSIVVALRPCEAKAEEPFNPLKLKGYFWETGKFYEGETSETNIAEILEELKETASLLQPFESLVSEGKFEELKTKLRGANFSESLLRIRGKRVLKLLSQQESTVEDDEKFREAEQAYVLLGKELNGLNGAIDSATVDFSRGALQLVASKKVVLAALETSGGIWRCPSPTPSRYNWVAVSCSDKYLSFFDADNSLKLVRRVQSKTAQRVLCWSEAAEVLFSGDHEGRILSWSLHKVKFGPFDDKTGEEKKEPTWRDFMKAGPLS
eukprot:symbB.v1.2.014933.t3/scaffold1103.1/size137753/9